MQITVEVLKKMGACEDGIEVFLREYPHGFSGKWTTKAQVAVLRTELRKYMGWAWRVGIVPAWSMKNVNLSGADLSGADLPNADLSNADLSGANLSGANLSGANLFGANLSNADLSDADLSRADLFGANLSGANLHNTEGTS